MKTISRYLMTLALLLTAVGGAWAQSTVQCSLDDITIEPGGSATTNFNLTNPDDKFCACQFTIQFPQGISIAYDTDEEEYVASLIRSKKNHSLDVVYNSVYTVTVASNQDFQGTEGPLINFSIVADNNAVAGNYDCYITNVTLTKTEGDPVTFESIPFKVTISGSEPADGDNTIDVTTNAASAQDLFTEASFEMPASDVTVDYLLVRDMQDETNPVAFSGLPSSGKIIVKKGSDDKYQPAEALTIQLIDPLAAAEAQNIIAADGITIKVLVGAENEKGAIDYDQENPITLEAFLADMKPGYYWIKAESAGENSPYDGTVYSQEFLVSNGYELTIAAGEYATFYKDENLYTEDKDAVLYTIANVTDTEAQLSDVITVAPANTPLLVYNKSEQEKTFLLIPTTDDAPEVTPAKEFMGSITSVELDASSSTADYYVLNGKAFVWVKGTINIGANKCWLQINNQLMAGRATTRSITGGGDTTNMDDVRWQMEDGNYYDLQGRKVEKPNRKGIYIKGGKKVIVR